MQSVVTGMEFAGMVDSYACNIAFPGILHVLEIVVLDEALGIQACADAVMITRAVVVVVIDVYPAVTDGGHPLTALGRPPVMMEGNMEIAYVISVGVTVSNEICVAS